MTAQRSYREADLSRSRERLATVALLFAVVLLALTLLVGPLGLLWFELDTVQRYNQHVDVFSAGLWLLLALVARSGASHRTVLRLGQCVIVAASFTLAFTSGLTAVASAGRLVPQTVTWATVWIVTYPLLIPSNARTTLAVLSCAALATPIGLALGMLAWGGPVDVAAVLGSSVAPGVGAVIATLGADLVHRNTVDIRRLEERETLLSRLLDGIDDAVLLRDADGHEVFAGRRRAPRAVLEGEGLVVEPGDRSETWAVFHREVHLDGRPHRLTVARRITAELDQAEVEVWKRLIRALSHELNNSLAPMSSLLHSMRRASAHPEHIARLPELIASLERRVEHLTTFLTEYASFARLPRPRPETVSWEDFVDGLRPLATFRVEGRLGGTAHIDAGQIEQVVLNLLKNAAESGSAEEDVTLAIARDGEGWVLSVSDRGQGLSPEVAEQATLPFFSTKQTGTGLGLALCRDIALAHGGGLSLTNREGGGAVARLWLPGR